MSTQSVVTRFGQSEQKRFKRVLRDRRQALLKDIEAIEREEAETGGEISSVPLHFADRGTECAAHDVSLGFRESFIRQIQGIDEALERVQDGSFGSCETCRKGISQARLDAIPYTRLCLACKTREEAN